MSISLPKELFIRGHKATDEQYKIISAVASGVPRIVINAFAGSGKTSTLEGIANIFPSNAKILYIAFNSSMSESAKKIFAKYSNVSVYTVHAFTRPHILQRGESLRKKNYTASEISRILDVSKKEAYGILKSFEFFCNSRHGEVGDRVKDRELVVELFDLMDRGDIEKTHSFYLKRFQLNLLNSLPMHLPEFDCVMLDEYQDTNGVTQSIYELLDAKQRVAVGDIYQNIYGFRHSLNRMDSAEGEHFYLTKSFRFGKEIASLASSFLSNFRGETREIVGLGKKEKAHTAISLSRTNAYLINVAMKMISNKVFFKTIRDAELIFSLPLNIASISEGGEPLSPQFKYLAWEYEDYEKDDDFDGSFAEYLKEVGKDNDDPELSFSGEMAERYRLRGLRGALAHITKNNNSYEPCSYYLGTAHSSKGLEFDIVKISDDFKDYFSIVAKWLAVSGTPIEAQDFLGTFIKEAKSGNVDKEIIEEINLFYVAITRASVKVFFEDEESVPVNKTRKEMNDIIRKKYYYFLHN